MTSFYPFSSSLSANVLYIVYTHFSMHIHVYMYIIVAAPMQRCNYYMHGYIIHCTCVYIVRVCTLISKLCLLVLPTDTDSGYASLPPTSLSQDSYELQLPPRPSLESSLSMDYSSSSSSSSSQAEARDDTDGSGMSRSLDRRLL